MTLNYWRECFSLAFTDFTQFNFSQKWSSDSSRGLVKNTQFMPFLGCSDLMPSEGLENFFFLTRNPVK